ncbi:hypothetical protein JTB14_029291 [Gonioctena quinquepunctata]|nr:hypothetical protein JTB14_029291 [Gonioctena quinquepunctata]
MRQGVVSSADAALKDARSEPDCTRPLLVPAVSQEATTPTAAVPAVRKHMLSRSQIESLLILKIKQQCRFTDTTFKVCIVECRYSKLHDDFLREKSPSRTRREDAK